MHLSITRLEGLRNDLLLRLDRAEIDSALLSIAHRDRLMKLPGIPRHRGATPEEQRILDDAKIPIEDHLRHLGVVDASGKAQRRAVAVSNRNLGTNHGHVAYQRLETPRVFLIREDPCDYPEYSCLTAWRSGALSIEALRFDTAGQRVHRAADGQDLSEEVEWATFGQPVLRAGRVARFDEIADQFYDIRHVLAFDADHQEGDAHRRAIYRDYPGAFRENVKAAWTERGVPRARYFHHAIGTSSRAVILVQREGTIEEIGEALKAAGADDGVILDNGGSVACWVWWANQYAGGLVSPTVDYRPPGTSVIAFLLKGAARTDLPAGSSSYSVL
jgi:hypothetical protein